MKKTIKSLLAIAIAAFAFTACSDVPEPYQIPGTGGGGEKGSELYSSANLKTGWTLKAVTADQPWSQGSSYVQATGYQKWDGADAKSNRAVEGWLISPAINTTGYENVKFSFDNTIKYTNNVTGWEANHKVYATSNYNESDINAATWVELDFTPVSSPYSDWTLYTSGEIQLPASMVGQQAIRIAFWFKAPANASTTWELMNFKVEEGIANNEPEPEPTPDGDVKTVSVADFLAAAESTSDWYQLTGTIKNLKDNDKYGNFDIEDATGSVYVYGLLAEKGGTKGQFQDLVTAKGIANGKKITIIGNRGAYNGTAQVANAYFVSIDGEGSDTPNPPAPSGDNLLTNGDFESWTGDAPDNWKTSSSAGNATLTKSTDAHGGSYSVSVGFAADANKRLGYKEMTLKAGSYTFSFYAKATTAEKSQTQAGFVNIKDDGKTDKYTYGGYVSLNNTEWTLVSTTFTLTADTKVSLIMMCPKNSDYAVAQNILVDDATLVTSDGGIADGGDTGGGDTPSGGDVQTVTVAQFNAAAVSTSVWYQLTGTVKNLKDGDKYGNFDLEDETGSVYVYGLLSEKGGAKQKFQELVTAKGIANGKKITIIGNRGDYQGKIEVTNAYFVSIE